MKIYARHWIVLAGLAVLGVASHLIPHGMGFSTVGALGMVAAAYLPKHLAAIPLLITVFAANVMIGAYGWVAMGFVYLAHVAAVFAVAPILKRVGISTVIASAVVNAVVFYLISNVSQVILFYPATLEGWIACYVDGLPFLMRGILANIVFGCLAFGAIVSMKQIYAHRLTSAQRN
jgi:hypothetical protein